MIIIILETIVIISLLVMLAVIISMFMEDVILKFNYNKMTTLGPKTRDELLFRQFRDKEVN